MTCSHPSFPRSIRNTYGENEHGTQRQSSVRQHGTEKRAPSSGTTGAAAVRERADAPQHFVYGPDRNTDSIHNVVHTTYCTCTWNRTLPRGMTCRGHSTQLSRQCWKCNITASPTNTNQVPDIHCYYIQKIVQIIDAVHVENARIYV